MAAPNRLRPALDYIAEALHGLKALMNGLDEAAFRRKRLKGTSPEGLLSLSSTNAIGSPESYTFSPEQKI